MEILKDYNKRALFCNYYPCATDVVSLIREHKERHDPDPYEHRDKLRKRPARCCCFVQLWNEVRASDVEKASGAERHHRTQEPLIRNADKESQCRSDNRGKRGEKIDEERFTLGKSRVQQHTEVADLLRNLMENDRDRRRDTDLNAHQIACADDHAVNEIMNSVRRNHKMPHRFDMLVRRIGPLA